MSILSAIKQQNSSIDDLAALPQALIMQMAQKKQISEEMLAPILARKAELADAFARQKTLETAGEIPPTVIEQLMAQNAQAEQPQMPEQSQMQQSMPQQMPQDMGLSQLPIPERQYAGGGIIAFDDGGEVDDMAYEMAREDADMNMGSSIQDIFNMAKRGAGRLRGMLPDSYETAKAKTVAQPTAFVNERKGDHPLEDKAIAAANKVGLDPRLMIHALYKETGGLKDPATAQSKAGAYGPMQLMPGTAKDLGVDRKDVDQNIYGGAMYLKQMMDKYKDPQLALAAYNAGPGRVDKALRSQAGLASLPRETQGYMKYAQGGEVKHFQYGGSTMGGFEDIYTDLGVPLIRPEVDEYTIDPMTGEKTFSGYSKPSKNTKTEKKTPATTPKEEPKQDLQTIFEDHTRRQQANPDKDIFAEIFARNEAQREEMKKSAAEDKNLALLAAGLGMMGGTSPYAFANIGQGAMKGVEYLGASKARRASEMNALSASDLKAMYYGEENKRKQRALTEGLTERAIDNIAAYDSKLRKNYFMEGVAPTPKQVEAYENAKRNDPIYQRLIKDSGVTTQAQPQKRTINFSTI